MPSNTKQRKNSKNKKKRMNMRAKMFLVLGLCSLALLITVVGCLLLISGIFGGTGGTGGTAIENEPHVVESGYDQTQNAIDVAEYATTILGESEDAGQTYVDETLFLGDSNTARMYRLFDFCTYANAIGSVGMSGSSLADYPCVQLSTSTKYITMPEAVAQLQPRRVIITFGTNDLNPNRTTTDFIATYQKGIEAVQAAYPSVDIIIGAIPPLGQEHSSSSLTQKQVDEYNKALVEMCKAKDWKFLNSAEVLKDSATGYAKVGYVETSDGIHLTEPAMEALFQYIRTHSYITDDDRPALTTIPTHTGEKDVVVYVPPTPTPEPVVVPETTEEPESESSEETTDSEDYVEGESSESSSGEATASPSPSPSPVPEEDVASSEATESDSASSEETDEAESTEASSAPAAPAKTEVSRTDPTCTDGGLITYSDGSTEPFGGPLGHVDNDGDGGCDRCGTPMA